jgi:hypothetical protein
LLDKALPNLLSLTCPTLAYEKVSPEDILSGESLINTPSKKCIGVTGFGREKMPGPSRRSMK